MSANIPGGKTNELGQIVVTVGSQTIVVPQQIIDAQRKVRYPFVYLIIVTPLIALCTYLVILSEGSEARLAAQIKQNLVATTATATVVTTPERGAARYTMTYTFSVPGSNQKFVNTDYSTDAASSLNTEEFNRLSTKLGLGINLNAQNGYRNTGPISIMYDSQDPAKNLTQFDIKTLRAPKTFAKEAVINVFLFWLFLFVPLGFLIRMIIRQNVWFKYQGQVLLQLRKARLQQKAETVEPATSK